MKTPVVSRRFTAALLSVSLVAFGTPRAQAAPHVVGQEQIAGRLLAAAETREARVRLFGEALSAEGAQKQARAMGLDPARLRAGVPHLSDKELADLSARALNVKDVRAGHGNDAFAILGIMLLIAGVAVLIAASNDGYYDDYCGCY
ncbi:MAG TPA: DUF6627 family protein [Vicinamibacteria bacterium]|nr:DUF6627 family protein [Vicinamibacteria bacterium]